MEVKIPAFAGMTVGAWERGGMTVGAGKRGNMGGRWAIVGDGRRRRVIRAGGQWSSRAGYPCGRAMGVAGGLSVRAGDGRRGRVIRAGGQWSSRAGHPHERRESNLSLGGFHG